MKFKIYFSLLVFLLIFILIFFGSEKFKKIDSNLSSQIDTALLAAGSTDYQNTLQNGYIKVPDRTGRFTQQQLQKVTAGKNDKDYTYSWTWGSKDKTATIASALGLDDLHHFVNSYLIDYMPFYTDKNWVPLYVLATRKRYQYDHLQYSGLTDVWQNSKQAFKQTRGDCEDHAIVLADWLISLDIDAHVVLGKYKKEGHAWVVVFKDGKEYLLEATGKKKLTRWSSYRLAGRETDYHPKYQFNRDDFWINTGSQYTVKYSGANWTRASTFYSNRQSM